MLRSLAAGCLFACASALRKGRTPESAAQETDAPASSMHTSRLRSMVLADDQWMWLAVVQAPITLYVLFLLLRRICRDGLRQVVKDALGALIASAAALPGVQGAVDAALNKEVAKMEAKMHGAGDPKAVIVLPAKGIPAKELLALADERSAVEDKSGKTWGGVYHETRGEPGELAKLQADMWSRFNSTNALYPTTFSSVRKFEAEIISMCVGLVHGHAPRAERPAGDSSPMKEWNCEGEAVGLLSSGGTESILIAMYAYRQLAHDRGIQSPEIIACYTAHPALDKACHYFNLKLTKLKAQQSTQQLRAADVAAAMTPQTIAIYASSPTFSHGVCDPIPELAVLARQRDVGLHVDNCLGGFWLTFLQREGKFQEPFDFQVPGVTTMSVDVHKYGFASKGVSVVAFRNAALRSLSWFPITDGPTLYVTPTLQGARSGAIMAQAWATLQHMGEDGYASAVRKLDAIFTEASDAVKATQGLRLLVESKLCIIAIASDDPAINIYVVASEMGKRGWNMNTSQGPACMAICIGEQHHGLIQGWKQDLKDSVEFIRANPSTKAEGDAGTYSTAEMLPANILDKVVRSYLDVKLTVKPAMAA